MPPSKPTVVPAVLYLSGPMSGYPDFNFPAFRAAAEKLRSEGFIVISPHENFGGETDHPRHTYMRADIMSVLQADAVCVLNGYMLSKGAKFEVLMAHELDIPVFRYCGRTDVIISKTSAASLQVRA